MPSFERSSSEVIQDGATLILRRVQDVMHETQVGHYRHVALKAQWVDGERARETGGKKRGSVAA